MSFAFLLDKHSLTTTVISVKRREIITVCMGRILCTPKIYSRAVFSIRKDALTACVGRWMTVQLESQDLQTVGSPSNTAPWSRRKICPPASWVVASTPCLCRCGRGSRTVSVLPMSGSRRRSDVASCLTVYGSPLFVSSSSLRYVNSVCVSVSVRHLVPALSFVSD